MGRFDELWPWADATADVKLHTLDIEHRGIDYLGIELDEGYHASSLPDDCDMFVVGNAITRGNAEASSWVGKVSDDQLSAIQHYTDDSFVRINGTLRGTYTPQNEARISN